MRAEPVIEWQKAMVRKASGYRRVSIGSGIASCAPPSNSQQPPGVVTSGHFWIYIKRFRHYCHNHPCLHETTNRILSLVRGLRRSASGTLRAPFSLSCSPAPLASGGATQSCRFNRERVSIQNFLAMMFSAQHDFCQ